jgi:hypothetical protein
MDYVQTPPDVADRKYRARRERLGLHELPETLSELWDWPELAWALAWLVAGRWWEREG